MPGNLSGVLKEYGIVLGFRANEDQYQQAMRLLAKFEKGTNQVAGAIGKNFAKGLVGVISLFGSVAAGANAMMKNMADADLETEKFANRMWMTERNARGLQETLKALKMDMGDINDIAIHPELRERFFALRKDASKYENADVDAGLKKIREFQFEFTRTQLLMSYAGRYIAYYLQMYLARPMEQIRLKLKAFNDNGLESVNKWAKRIAKFAEIVVRLGTTAIHAVSDIITAIQKLPPAVKAVAAILAGIGLVLAAPWLAVSAAILGVLLLLDDFYTWKRGGKSAFGELWEEVEELKASFANNTGKKALDDINQSALALLETLENISGILSVIWDVVFPYLKAGAENLMNFIVDKLEKVRFILQLVAYFTGLIDKVLHGELNLTDIPGQIMSDLKAWAKENQPEGEPDPDETEPKKDPTDIALDIVRSSGLVPSWMIPRIGEETEKQNGFLKKAENVFGTMEKLFPSFLFQQNPQAAPALQPVTMPVTANSPQNQVYNTTTSTRNQKTYQIQQDNRMTQNNTFNVTGSEARANARTISTYLKTAQNRAESGWANGRIPNLDKIDKN